MVIMRPLLIAAALLAASFASASPLQAADRLEERVPFCESRNSIVVSIRQSPQATGFCSAFLNIGAPTTTTTVLRTVRTITTRPVAVSTTLTTGTATSTPEAVTSFTDQVNVVQETPSSTQTIVVTEASVEVSVTVATETSTISEPSTIFETSVSTETSVITELTETSTTSFIATTTRTTLADDVLRRGAAQATPAALYDKRLLSPNDIRTAREMISSACSCIVKRPVQRTRTTTSSVTFTSVLPPTSTQTVLTVTTTALPQASTTVTREILTTTTLPTAVSITLTTVTTPTTTETQTTTTSPFTVTYPTTDLDQSATTTLTTTTTTSTSVVEATQTANVAYVDRCNVQGTAPTAQPFVDSTPSRVSQAACGNECQRDAQCKSWTWENATCKLYAVNLLRGGFVEDASGPLSGWDRSCTVPPSLTKPPVSCGVKGISTLAPLSPPTMLASNKLCSDACYDSANCLSYAFNEDTTACSLFDAGVSSHLLLDAFRANIRYSDRLCIEPPERCGVVGKTNIAPRSVEFTFTSEAACAEGCRSASPAGNCEAYGYQGNYGSRIYSCNFYTTKTAKLNVRPETDTTILPFRFSDRTCTPPAPEAIACGTPADPFWGFFSSETSPSLAACSGFCNRNALCRTFLYNAATRRCEISGSVIDAATRSNPSSARRAYSKGCPAPYPRVCDANGQFATAPPLATSVTRSYSECAQTCQDSATCKSFAYYAFSSVTCYLYSVGSGEAGFDPVTYSAFRWADRECALPPATLCVAQANNYPTTAIRRARTLAVGFDNISQCEDLCRRDTLCRSYSYSTQGGQSSSCRTYSLAISDLAGLSLQPTGTITYTNMQDCSTLPLISSGLQDICGPPVSTKPRGSFIGIANTATTRQACAILCRDNAQCQSYSNYANGPTLGCFLFYERAVNSMVTLGPDFDSGYAKLIGSYERTCPIPA